MPSIFWGAICQCQTAKDSISSLLRADRGVIADTSTPFSKLNAALTFAKPKSVTIFLDACYSGQSRSGEILGASARPVKLKPETRYFPENFTVITASQNDQISSSNPDLKHRIFSYYLMKVMEGGADAIAMIRLR